MKRVVFSKLHILVLLLSACLSAPSIHPYQFYCMHFFELQFTFRNPLKKHSVGLLIPVPGPVRKSSIRWKVASRAWRGRERKRERGALTAIWAPPPPDPTCGRPRDGWPAKERNHLCSMPSMPEGHHLKLSVRKRQDFSPLSFSLTIIASVYPPLWQ